MMTRNDMAPPSSPPASEPGDTTRSEARISTEMGRNIILFSAAMATLPAELLEHPQTGKAAMVGLERILRANREAGGQVAWSNGQKSQPITRAGIAADPLTLLLNDQTIPIQHAIFHRSVLSAFDHILVEATAASAISPFLICARHSPLLDSSGQRLLARHFRRIREGSGSVADLQRELHGIAAMLQQGDPMGEP